MSAVSRADERLVGDSEFRTHGLELVRDLHVFAVATMDPTVTMDDGRVISVQDRSDRVVGESQCPKNEHGDVARVRCASVPSGPRQILDRDVEDICNGTEDVVGRLEHLP